MITFSLQNGVVATLRTSGTEPKIKFYSEYCAAPGIRSADPLSTPQCRDGRGVATKNTGLPPGGWLQQAVLVTLMVSFSLLLDERRRGRGIVNDS